MIGGFLKIVFSRGWFSMYGTPVFHHDFVKIFYCILSRIFYLAFFISHFYLAFLSRIFYLAFSSRNFFSSPTKSHLECPLQASVEMSPFQDEYKGNIVNANLLFYWRPPWVRCAIRLNLVTSLTRCLLRYDLDKIVFAYSFTFWEVYQSLCLQSILLLVCGASCK